MKLKNKKTGLVVDVELVETNSILEKHGVATFEGKELTIKNLYDEWEDYEGPEEYWYIDFNGEVKEFKLLGFEWQGWMKEIGNYFETKEEAERAVEKLKAWKRLKDRGVSLHFQKQFRGDGIGYSRTIYTDFSKDSQEIVKDLDLLFGGEDE